MITTTREVYYTLVQICPQKQLSSVHELVLKLEKLRTHLLGFWGKC